MLWTNMSTSLRTPLAFKGMLSMSSVTAISCVFSTGSSADQRHLGQTAAAKGLVVGGYTVFYTDGKVIHQEDPEMVVEAC